MPAVRLDGIAATAVRLVSGGLGVLTLGVALVTFFLAVGASSEAGAPGDALVTVNTDLPVAASQVRTVSSTSMVAERTTLSIAPMLSLATQHPNGQPPEGLTAPEAKLDMEVLAVEGMSPDGAEQFQFIPQYSEPSPGPEPKPEPEPEPEPQPAAPAAPVAAYSGPVNVTGSIHNVNLTFYDCADQGFCGAMYNGEQVHEGAAACSWNLALGTAFSIEGDPTGRIYVCKDRGLLADTWVDIFWYHPSDGYNWQSAVGRYGTINIVNVP